VYDILEANLKKHVDLCLASLWEYSPPAAILPVIHLQLVVVSLAACHGSITSK